MIMESDTKKQRGRPRSAVGNLARKFPSTEENGLRANMNQSYAARFAVGVLSQRPGDFFFTESGKLRRQAIAEQLGRICESGLLNAEQCEELAQSAIDDYRSGSSVKQVAQRLRDFREMMR